MAEFEILKLKLEAWQEQEQEMNQKRWQNWQVRKHAPGQGLEKPPDPVTLNIIHEFRSGCIFDKTHS